MLDDAGPEELRRLLDAVGAVGSELELSVVLQRITESAADLVGARFAALGVLDESRTTLADFVIHGLDDDEVAAIGHLPTGHGILGVLINDPRPIRLSNLGAHPESSGFPEHHPGMTSFLGVPIMIRGVAFGNLYLCDKAGGLPFTELDESLTVALAGAAGVAIDHARLLSRVAEIARYEDRDRIARDLHDTAIQRLFAIGLGLQGILRVVDQPEAVRRIEDAVDDLDRTVREIRSAIFELRSTRITEGSTRQAVIELASECARALGFEPSLRFDGPVDTLIDGVRAEQLLAVQREALSNVAKHARATRVDVSLAATDGELTLRVVDNGVGGAATACAGLGLRNMGERAQRFGGRLDVQPAESGGTDLRWIIPLG